MAAELAELADLLRWQVPQARPAAKSADGNDVEWSERVTACNEALPMAASTSGRTPVSIRGARGSFHASHAETEDPVLLLPGSGTRACLVQWRLAGRGPLAPCRAEICLNQAAAHHVVGCAMYAPRSQVLTLRSYRAAELDEPVTSAEQLLIVLPAPERSHAPRARRP